MSEISEIRDDEIRIVLLLMIKNESRIVKRCIESCIGYVDGIVIDDTGSTDNTVEVLMEYFKGKPELLCGIYQHKWKNFGHNRTLSFKSARDFIRRLGWREERSYVLAMDADMILRSRVDLKRILSAKLNTGYLLVQKAGELFYHNMRIMRSDYDWKCIGATHEYWSGPYEGGTIDQNVVWIDDMNDGGCKSDKFERDLRMLKEELDEDPNNCRTHFYYAQTLRCLGRKEESIEAYKKRIELGGWFEEVWYSYYSIGLMYIELGDINNAELWVEKSYEYNKYRSEALYILVKYHRHYGNFWKSMHYLKRALSIPKPAVALFLETNIYDYELLYELSIISYYLSADRVDGAKHSMGYLCLRNSSIIYSNLKFYTESISKYIKIINEGKIQGVGWELLGKGEEKGEEKGEDRIKRWRESSCSLVKWRGKRVMNCRVVNYGVSKEGSYGVLDKAKDYDERMGDIIRTRNFIMYNGEYRELMIRKSRYESTCRIRGLEDIRLFTVNNELWFTGTSTEWNSEHKYRMMLGRCKYNEEKKQWETDILRELRCYEEEKDITSECEKNWAICEGMNERGRLIDNPVCIYGWKPYRVGTIDMESILGDKEMDEGDVERNEVKTGRLYINVKDYSVPEYFENIRGSTNFVEYGDELWGICHAVHYGNPRKYMHHFMKLESVTKKPIGISVPYSFGNESIEYCLGMIISDTGVMSIIWSTYDSDPRYMEINVGDIESKYMIKIG